MSVHGLAARLAIVGGAALVALCAAWSVPGGARADAPSASFSIDAIPGGAIDTARSVPVGSKFSVAVVLDTYTGPVYQSYQVVLVYDDVELDGDTGLPGNWDNPPVADVTGGNTVVFPNGPLCDPSPTTNSVASEDDSGTGSITMTCADTATNGRTSHVGGLVEIVLECTDGGTADLSLSDAASTFIVDDTANSLHDHTHVATITCGGDPVPTNTPGAATTTPAAATATPGGAQPTSVPPTAPPAANTPTTGIGGPDTGAGPGGDASSGSGWLFAAVAVAVVGAALAGAGYTRRGVARR